MKVAAKALMQISQWVFGLTFHFKETCNHGGENAENLLPFQVAAEVLLLCHSVRA